MIPEEKNRFQTAEKISSIILFFLLTVRIVDTYLPIWIFGTDIPGWFSYWYAGSIYILTVTIIWLNRHRLTLLNIDRPYVFLVILGGIFYVFFLTPDIGVLVGITAGFMYWAYTNNHLVIANSTRYPPGTVLLISTSILLAFLPVFLFAHPTYKFSLSIQSVTAAFFQAHLGAVVFEELIIRGALWAYLRELGLRDNTIFYLQAIIFWLSHHSYMSLDNPYAFWVAVPVTALLLGGLVWYSKSLTPSTISHFLFNFITVLIRSV